MKKATNTILISISILTLLVIAILFSEDLIHNNRNYNNVNSFPKSSEPNSVNNSVNENNIDINEQTNNVQENEKEKVGKITPIGSTYEYDLKNSCISNLNEKAYDEEKYVYNSFTIKNVKMNNNNYTFKYIATKDGVYYYLNEKLIDFKTPSNDLIVSVCNYDNTLIVNRGWEGFKNNDIYSYDEKLLSFVGNYEYKDNLLYIQVHDYASNNDYFTLTTYSINLKKLPLEKNYIKVDKISCSEDVSGC